ncbi:MAG TPA: hypothetical protein VGD98_23235 [Ktedonobacteraceae bacterium]
MSTQQAIRRGILQSFDNNSYTGTVLIIEATNYVLSTVPVATTLDGTSALEGAACVVLFFDESNHSDAVIIAVYGTTPSGFPGRTVMASSTQKLNAQVINAGVTGTFTLTGGNIPLGAQAVIYSAQFSSPTSAAFLQLAPHSALIGGYASIGNLSAANATMRGNGIIGLDPSGQIDIKANTGNCTVSLWTYGYLI